MSKKISKLFDSELMFDFLLLILGIVIVLVSWGYGFGTWKRPGPGLYPFFLGLIIILPFSLALIIRGFRAKKSERRFDKSSLITFSLMIVSFIFWIVSLPVLGYVVATFCVTYALGKILRLEGWIRPLILSAGTSIFIYLLFDYWLYIDLPRGILE